MRRRPFRGQRLQSQPVLRTLIDSALRHYAGGTGLFLPAATPGGAAPGSVLVLAPGPVPTADIYLAARLPQYCPAGEIRVIDTRASQPPLEPPPAGAAAIIVRHAPDAWLDWLEAHRAGLGRVIFLLDDDIPAALAAPELPFGYALRTAARYARARRRLARLCDAIWVSTAELARRYADCAPELCEPAYVPPRAGAVRRAAADGPAYCYHGTWAHRREIEWLLPVIAAVQSACPGAHFEIVGDARVRRMFRGIPRVAVRAPMSWPQYLAYASTVSFQVGLAPCLDTPFNRARSHVKFFDITRLGAVGIYSDAPPYADKIRHGDTGWLCANRQEDWSRAIVMLLGDEPRRATILARAERDCLDARGAFPRLCRA